MFFDEEVKMNLLLSACLVPFIPIAWVLDTYSGKIQGHFNTLLKKSGVRQK